MREKKKRWREFLNVGGKSQAGFYIAVAMRSRHLVATSLLPTVIAEKVARPK